MSLLLRAILLLAKNGKRVRVYVRALYWIVSKRILSSDIITQALVFEIKVLLIY